MTLPVPDGFVFEPAPTLSKLRRNTFCLYSGDSVRAASVIASLSNKVAGLFIFPGTDWEWRACGGACYQWSIPASMLPFLSSFAQPYLHIIEQLHHYEGKVTAQAWDLQRAAQDRLFLSRIQLEFRDSMLDAERNLREAHRYLNQIIESLPDATMVIDRAKKVTAWNRAMELLSGIPKEDMLGKGDNEYAIPFYGERRPTLVDLLYISDNALTDKYDFVRLEGNCLVAEAFAPMVYGGKGSHLLGSASLLYDQDGNVIGAIESIRDVSGWHEAMTELRRAKLTAEEANRAKSQFLSNVSHEIRTPLNGIIGFTELIMRENNPLTVHTMARSVLKESDILLSLVNAVLDQARIESGKIEIANKASDLMELLDTAAQAVKIQAQKKGISIRVEHSEDVPHFVLSDRLRLCQVLMNLMNNSVKFTERGSVLLRVSVERRELEKVWVRFEVIDTGSGIPDNKRHLIFQRFAQVDAGASRKHGGAGLGLSIAHGLVELMGGTIGFESEVGTGSTFWFVLPLSVCEKQTNLQALKETNADWQVTWSNCPSCPILLVEDYVPNQEVARMHLEGAGYQVDIAGDGAAALQRCETTEYSLILMDIQMPVMDGFEATRQLRQRSGWTKNVAILGLSANADEKSRIDCMTAGMNGLVTKPLRRNTFLSEVAFRLSGASSNCDCLPALTPKESTDLPMDYKQAVEEFAGDHSLLDSVVARFLIMARKQLADLKGFVTAGDAAAIGREAHKIKGAAGNLTAMPLSEVAKVMEEMGKSGNLLGINALVGQLEKELDTLDRFVKNGYAC
jgi:signal transduction histidine kinase/HPt (histidine-containing phosphotransfer) domain-containing protein